MTRTSAWPLLVAGALAAAAAGPRPARADDTGADAPAPGSFRSDFRNRPHLYAGLAGHGLVALAQATDYDPAYLGRLGGGLAAFGGLRLLPRVAAEAHVTAALQQTGWHAQTAASVPLERTLVVVFGGDVRAYLTTVGRAEVYALAGVGMANVLASYPDDPRYAGFDRVFARGIALDVGAGVDHWLGPYLSLGARALHRGMLLWEPTVDVEAKHRDLVSSLAVDVFVCLHL